MPSIPYILIGALFSLVSGYITWLSWKDTRKVYKMIASHDERLSALENSARESGEKLLHS